MYSWILCVFFVASHWVTNTKDPQRHDGITKFCILLSSGIKSSARYSANVQSRFCYPLYNSALFGYAISPRSKDQKRTCPLHLNDRLTAIQMAGFVRLAHHLLPGSRCVQ